MSAIMISDLFAVTRAQRDYLLDLFERMEPVERKQLLDYAREMLDAEPFVEVPR